MLKRLLSILMLLTLFLGVSAIDANTGGQTPYTIKFNANGGTGTMANQQCNSVYETTLNRNTFTYSGYSFEGWALSADGSVAFPDEAIVMIADFPSASPGSTVNLYAKWKQSTITVEYNGGDANGSVNGAMNDSTHDKGTGNLSIVNFFKQGFAFLGWKQDSNTNYVVEFRANGGSTVHTISSSKLPDPLPVPTRDGYQFEGWYSDAGLTNKVNAGDKVNSNMTLYAKWTETTPRYNLTYDPNGGLPIEGQRVTHIPSVLPIATGNAGYNFDKWYTDQSLTNEAVSGTALNADTTLYAGWKPLAYYWGIDSSNKLIISDKPVTTATDDRAGSFAKTMAFNYGATPWHSYANDITSIEVAKVDNNVAPVSTAYWFQDLKNVVSVDVSNLDTSNVTNMSQMFYYTGYNVTDSFTVTGMENWNTPKATNMSYMFYYTGYNAATWSIGDISSWNTQNVTNMSYMFYYAGYKASTWTIGNIGNWNIEKVTNMSAMFGEAGYNASSWSIGDLSNWNTEKVTKVSDMFHNAGDKATLFNVGDLSTKIVTVNGNTYTAWDVSNIINMSNMFSVSSSNGCSNNDINIGDISNWNTSKVTNMSQMFFGRWDNANFNIGDLSTKEVTVGDNTYTAWNVSNVTNMSGMFCNAGANATTFDIGNIGNWNTSKVKNMSSMFINAGNKSVAFNLDLSAWDTSSVTTMNSMFAGAGRNATTWSVGNISNWNTSNVTNMSYMFNSASENAITELDLSGWDATNVTDMRYMFSGINSLETIKTPKNIQNDVALSYITGKTFYDTTDNNKEYAAGTFPTGNGNTSHTLTSVDPNYYWGIDATNKLIISDKPVITATDDRAGSFSKTLSINSTSGQPWYSYRDDIVSVEVVKVNKKVAPISTAYWFRDLKNITTINVANLDTSNVTDMSWMFGHAGYNATTFAITGMDSWDTSNVTTMQYMFGYAGNNANSFNIGNLGSWNTSKVTDMSYMFKDAGYNATIWNIGDLSSWNTSNVKYMLSMFGSAGNTATTWSVGDLRNWNTSNVTNMYNMFYGAGHESNTFDIGDIGNWDVSNVTDMQGMFNAAGYKATTWSVGDLSNWNTGKVTNMYNMFGLAGNNATIFNVGNLNTKTVTVGGNTYTAWDVSNVSDMSYMFAHAGQNATAWSIGGVGNWNTSNVIKMDSMFTGVSTNTTTFNIGDLSTKTVTVGANTYVAWDVSNVNNMMHMFSGAGRNATTFNLDLSSWDTSKVTNMSDMFYNTGSNATSWSIGNLSTKTVTVNGNTYTAWNTSNVTDMGDMFANAGINAITELDLSGWDASNVTDMGNMFYGIDTLKTIKTPKNIQTSTVIAGITSKKFYDVTDNNKEYAAGTFPIGITTSHTLVDVKPREESCLSGTLTTLSANIDTSITTVESSSFYAVRPTQISVNYKVSVRDPDGAGKGLVPAFIVEGYTTEGNWITLYSKYGSSSNDEITENANKTITTSKYITKIRVRCPNRANITTSPHVVKLTGWCESEYFINYEVNGGTMPSTYVKAYKPSEGSSTLPTPTKDGYIFAGWSESSNFRTGTITSIASGKYGDKTLYAKWDVVSQTISGQITASSKGWIGSSFNNLNIIPMKLQVRWWWAGACDSNCPVANFTFTFYFADGTTAKQSLSGISRDSTATLSVSAANQKPVTKITVSGSDTVGAGISKGWSDPYPIISEYKEITSLYNTQLNPQMTSNTAPSGVVTASGTDEGQPYLAFNYSSIANSSSMWRSKSVSNGSQWLKYEFPETVKVTSFEFTNPTDGSYSTKSVFKLQASNNDSTWTDLWNGTISDVGKVVTQSVNNENFYKYYRILTSTNNNTYDAGSFRVSHLKFIGDKQ